MATTVPTAMAAKIANMKLTTTSTQREGRPVGRPRRKRHRSPVLSRSDA
jgi:hypothetical protein